MSLLEPWVNEIQESVTPHKKPIEAPIVVKPPEETPQVTESEKDKLVVWEG